MVSGDTIGHLLSQTHFLLNHYFNSNLNIHFNIYRGHVTSVVAFNTVLTFHTISVLIYGENFPKNNKREINVKENKLSKMLI